MGTNFAVAPGEYLQEWIDGNGMSVGEFAVELGVTVAEIEDLLTGKEAIGREIACQLERVTSIPSDSWIRFELKYREDLKRMSVGSEESCTCVNQLNEGVHIKGVDAVIMVRRTSSPTIFYQQLGRALTAAGNFEPLVIDLVDNFEMIGIEQIVSMMSESYARLSGENDPEELIPPSAFKVIDHEKDARHLAKNLERRLALRSEKLTIDEKIALWKGL